MKEASKESAMFDLGRAKRSSVLRITSSAMLLVIGLRNISNQRVPIPVLPPSL